MSMRNTYYWVTGSDRNGAVTTAGPYMTADEAQDATSHLSRTQVHVLHTRQHDKARRILRTKMMQGGGGGQYAPHSDEPMDRPSMAQRFRDLLKPKARDEYEGDD